MDNPGYNLRPNGESNAAIERQGFGGLAQESFGGYADAGEQILGAEVSTMPSSGEEVVVGNFEDGNSAEAGVFEVLSEAQRPAEEAVSNATTESDMAQPMETDARAVEAITGKYAKDPSRLVAAMTELRRRG